MRTNPTEIKPDSPEKRAAQSVLFANRLEKQYKHLKKWAKRTNTTCFRLYDKDIPEIPLAVDIYASGGENYLHVSLYERPYDKDAHEEEIWMAAMTEAAADVLGVSPERVFAKIRKKQRGEEAQYERMDRKGSRLIVEEGTSRFLVNLSDYLDTGLFLDHRPARLLVRSRSEGKKVLNLFCYTGAFSVHAAAGGAKRVTSVDLSKTYLAWAEDNMRLNGFETRGNSPAYEFVQADVKAFLASASREQNRWDLIICDPPTFSNSKRTVDTLDINRDWAALCRSCLALLESGGELYFSTNSRSLGFDASLIGGAAARESTRIEDLTALSIPEDFRNKKIHRLWRFTV